MKKGDLRQQIPFSVSGFHGAFNEFENRHGIDGNYASPYSRLVMIPGCGTG